MSISVAVLLALVSVTAAQNVTSTSSCMDAVRKFDPFMHKKVYTVGLHAINGLETARAESSVMFQDFLTLTAGQRFDPPIRYVPAWFSSPDITVLYPDC
jgi:hypothetical protein